MERLTYLDVIVKDRREQTKGGENFSGLSDACKRPLKPIEHENFIMFLAILTGPS